jgi:hypothetical protein
MKALLESYIHIKARQVCFGTGALQNVTTFCKNVGFTH